MQPARAGVGEGRGDRDRIVLEGGLALEVALLEPDDPAAAQVDRRQHVERALPSLLTMLAY